MIAVPESAALLGPKCNWETKGPWNIALDVGCKNRSKMPFSFQAIFILKDFLTNSEPKRCQFWQNFSFYGAIFVPSMHQRSWSIFLGPPLAHHVGVAVPNHAKEPIRALAGLLWLVESRGLALPPLHNVPAVDSRFWTVPIQKQNGSYRPLGRSLVVTVLMSPCA